MLVLLPPSETKIAVPSEEQAALGARFFDAEGDLPAETGEGGSETVVAARAAVLAALQELSRAGDEAAHKALKLRPGGKAEAAFAANLAIGTPGSSPAALPAIVRYTGVLYDALGLGSLSPAALTWLARHVAIQSALFGLVSAASPLPDYRLSAGSRLPALGQPLKRVWSAAYSDYDWCAHGFILDLRSNDYAELAPVPAECDSVKLLLAERQADGSLRALNHFNKAGKGDLVRRLASAEAEISSTSEFAAWCGANGLELLQDGSQFTLVTSFGASK
ncbi:MAG: peroxide stress protein YaaA [Microbacteriaceae bacterium]|nr:peroxide stress protein YaaA [Microbacteriaceae bacterium]